jgi:hypothetical protein
MSLIKLKNGVNFVLSPEMHVLVGWMARRWQEHGLGAFVITSGRDGAHREGSLHYSGNAVDIRTRHLFDGKHHTSDLLDFALMLQAQKVGMRVVVHPDWVPGVAHLHVGYASKEGESGVWEWAD